MKANYHTHVARCRHARGEAIDYALKAEQLGLDILGFSDHAPFKDKDYGYRMPYIELKPYCEEIDNLKNQFDGRLKIYRSLEIEYMERYDRGFDSYYSYLLEDLGMDYLLCGEHFFYDSFNHFHNITSAESPDVIIQYAKACVKAMHTGYFKILAHPDLFGINDFGWGKEHDQATEMIIQAAVDTGTVLEYNANGRRRGIKKFHDGERFQYPLDRFWLKVKEAGAKCVVGSDCHDYEILWDKEVENSFDYLNSIGITPLEKVDIYQEIAL